ncbi:MAG: DUF4834 family protein [Bacteroidales bacterium]|nr:DUF4834 family protein [Bacteroidales bacterium]
MFKFIITTLAILVFFSLLFGVSTLRFIFRLLFGKRRNSQNTSYQANQKPESQNDRIITYKKKEFEISAAEDVDFEEVKDEDK